jgi:hypothetical protein
LLIALQGALLGLLRRKPKASQQQPAAADAVRHAKLALHQLAHPLDGPQLRRETGLQRTIEQRGSQGIALRLV